mgnify:CR=1 FL=1
MSTSFSWDAGISFFDKGLKVVLVSLCLAGSAAAQVDTILMQLGDALHADWQATARASGRTERYKPVKVSGKPLTASSRQEIEAYCDTVGVPADLRAKFRIADGGAVEQDILAIPNRFLSANNRGENDASAKVVLTAIQDQLGAGGTLDDAFVEKASVVVHDEWMKRNSSWAPPEQMLPFDKLSQVEADKDRAMVRIGIKLAQSSGL